MKPIPLLALVAAAALARGDEPAPADPGAEAAPAAGTVTFLAGEATRAAGDRKEALAVGGRVRPGDVLETRRRTRLEVRLADESLLRIGPSSRVALRSAVFGATPEDRRVSAHLDAGSVWANVVHALGAASRFEIGTETAVAGVRGTVLRVEAAEDGSCGVKVYEGTVGVSEPERGPGGAPPAGPGRWERTVTAMSEVRVPARGAPGQPARFALAPAGRDEFESWNLGRDEQARKERDVRREERREGHRHRERPGR